MKKLWQLYQNWKTKRLLRKIKGLQDKRVLLINAIESTEDESVRESLRRHHRKITDELFWLKAREIARKTY